MYIYLSYSDLKSNSNYAIHIKKDKKIKVLMKSCLHFFIFSCRLNSKTFKCREILHFQKHSSLRNCFWKRTMFFIFSFLVADMQLYKRLCPSVGWSVGRSVEVIELKTRISAPAHPSATGGRVSGLVFF